MVGTRYVVCRYVLRLCTGRADACSYPSVTGSPPLILIRQDPKSDNLQYNTVGRWVDGTIVPPSDGPMFILIDWGSVPLT